VTTLVVRGVVTSSIPGVRSDWGPQRLEATETQLGGDML